MKYGAYVQLDKSNPLVSQNSSEHNICQLGETTPEIARNSLLNNFGSVAKEIIVFDEFGECMTIKED